MTGIDNILANCISDIQEGRRTLESCLADYPSVRQELEPLLNVALSIKEPPAFKPTNDFKVRTRVQLMEYIHDSKMNKDSRSGLFQHGIRQPWSRGWLKTATIAVAVLLLFSTLTAGTVYAAGNSLPGDALYSLKITAEKVRSSFTFNNVASVDLELVFAQTRLKEMKSLTNKNINNISLANAGYERNISNAIRETENIRDENTLISELEIISMAVLGHVADIDEMFDGVQTNQRERFRETLEIAIMLQQRALLSLAEHDPQRATEINIVSMQNRLNRADILANRGEISGAEQALWQFQAMLRLGEEISQIGKEFGFGTESIHASNIAVLTYQIEMITSMQGKIPAVIIESIKDTIGESLEYHNREGGGPPGNGNNPPLEPGNNPDEPGNTPDEPGNNPGDPGNTPEEPSNPPSEPGNKPDEPGNMPDEPGDKSD